MFLFIQKNLNFIILLLIFIAVSFYFYYRLEDIHNDILELKLEQKKQYIDKTEKEDKKEAIHFDNLVSSIPYDQFLSEIEETEENYNTSSNL
jgi:hypothetical protein